MLGGADVLQLFGAEIRETRTRGQLRADKLGGDSREQHLAAFRERSQARAAIDGRAVVVAVAQLDLSRVDRHADANRRAGDPAFCVERAL